MKHVVLLGDSIFDNKAYVGDGPDVIEQLERGVAATAGPRRSTRVDGSTTSDIKGQLDRPCRRTRPISWCRSAATTRCRQQGPDRGEGALGGRGARQARQDQGRLQEELRRHARRSWWRGSSRSRSAPSTRRATTIPPRARSPAPGSPSSTTSSCAKPSPAALPVIDLRLIFDDDADYANDIEPSVKGGAKIARAIATLVTTHDFTRRRSEIYV